MRLLGSKPTKPPLNVEKLAKVRELLSAEVDARGMAHIALAAATDAVEQLVEALAGEFGQGGADRPADHVAVGDQLPVGGVGDGEDLLGPFELGPERRRILSQASKKEL